MRLFVAIQFSDEMQKSIINLMHDLKSKGIRGNFTPAQNLHMTLCFIGETRDREKIQQALSAIKYKPFKLSASELGRFGDLLWLGARSGQALHALASDIRKALSEANISYDEKKFTPHITLIRKMAGNMPKMTIPKMDMLVKKVSLMKSEQVKGKVAYTEIFSF